MRDMITFVRRRGLGAGSLRGMTSYLNGLSERPTSLSVKKHTGQHASILRNDMIGVVQGQEVLSSADLVVRWGCTSILGVPLEKQVNPSLAIKRVGDKLGCRKILREIDPTLIPATVTSEDRDYESNSVDTSLVLRPRHHAQGKNLFVCNGLEEVLNVVASKPRTFSNGWYASELIDKVAEYRVYVVQGRVATVARKTPDNPEAVAWNVAQGGRFDVVRWGEWPLEVCRVAIEAHNHVPDLDFSGVDVMVAGEGRAYVIELNSAPSLPLLSDGSISYRQKCMAKCFKYMSEQGKEKLEVEGVPTGWRGYIHPSITAEENP